LIAVAIAASVSRSAIIAVAITMGFFVVMMPVRQRIVALAALPLALIAVFVSAHGLLGTLGTFLGYGTGDPSIAHRVDNYSYVEMLVHQAPWVGHGGGTYIPAADDVHVFDNQYLTTAVELGLFGIIALGALFLVPMIAALTARQRSANPELRLLCAALAGGALASGVCSATFDSLGFPMFYCVYALILGLIGACWRFAPEREIAEMSYVPQSTCSTLFPATAAVAVPGEACVPTEGDKWT
jgi:O-antigen ligase